MDETLRRRLVGAAFLLIVAFVLVSLLPRRPEGPAVAAEGDVVTINLREPEIIYDQTAVIGTPADDVAAAAVDESEAEDAAPELADPSAVAVAPSPTPVPRPTARPTPRPSPKPTAQPTPAPKPKPTPSPAPTAIPAQAPAAAATAQLWWVQLGSFSDIDNARQVETKLKALGQTGVIAPIATPKGTLYRVRSGPFAHSDAAESAHRTVVSAGYKDARVIAP